MEASKELPFQWTSDFSVGVDELDEDHQMLFELLNHLRVTIKAGDASALPWIINDIQQYAIYHFSHEEEMMMACHYQFIDNHKLVHRMLETRIQDFIDNPEYKENLKAATWFVSFLEHWLIDHVKGMDKYYSEAMNKMIKESA